MGLGHASARLGNVYFRSKFILPSAELQTEQRISNHVKYHESCIVIQLTPSVLCETRLCPGGPREEKSRCYSGPSATQV